jgi:Putative transposase of IS4/5 family (DUF4096)
MDRKAYPSDVSDEEWALVAPHLTLMTEDAPQRDFPLREVFNGLRYIVRTGAPWRLMSHDLPPGMSSINNPNAESKPASSSHSSMICAPCYGSSKGAKKARPPQSLMAGPCNRRPREAPAPAMTAPNVGNAARSIWLSIRSGICLPCS